MSRTPFSDGMPTTSCRKHSEFVVAMEDRPFAAFLVVHDDLQGQAGPARANRQRAGGGHSRSRWRVDRVMSSVAREPVRPARAGPGRIGVRSSRKYRTSRRPWRQSPATSPAILANRRRFLSMAWKSQKFWARIEACETPSSPTSTAATSPSPMHRRTRHGSRLAAGGGLALGQGRVRRRRLRGLHGGAGHAQGRRPAMAGGGILPVVSADARRPRRA